MNIARKYIDDFEGYRLFLQDIGVKFLPSLYTCYRPDLRIENKCDECNFKKYARCRYNGYVADKITRSRTVSDDVIIKQLERMDNKKNRRRKRS